MRKQAPTSFYARIPETAHHLVFRCVYDETAPRPHTVRSLARTLDSNINNATDTRICTLPLSLPTVHLLLLHANVLDLLLLCANVPLAWYLAGYFSHLPLCAFLTSLRTPFFAYLFSLPTRVPPSYPGTRDLACAFPCITTSTVSTCLSVRARPAPCYARHAPAYTFSDRMFLLTTERTPRKAQACHHSTRGTDHGDSLNLAHASLSHVVA